MELDEIHGSHLTPFAFHRCDHSDVRYSLAIFTVPLIKLGYNEKDVTRNGN